MSCNCSAQGAQPCRCGFLKNKTAPSRAYIDKCVDCDPCESCESMVKICSFVAVNMEDVVTRRNSFVYNQEDDAVYYVDDSGNPLRFGASPMFIDNFDPETRTIKRQIVIDAVNKKLYAYAPDGTYILFELDVEEEVGRKVSEKINQMAEDGTLENLIGNYFYRNVKYVFPKAGRLSGDSNLIIYDDNDVKKSILIDANMESEWGMLHEMLVKYGITHLDYFIISHYDSDHIGSVQHLVDYNFIDQDTIVLTPAQVTTYSQSYENSISATNAIFSNNNIPYRTPSEKETLNIYGDLKVTFANVDLSIVESYSNKENNSASMVCLFDHNGVKSFYTGDMTRVVMDYLQSINFPDSTVNLYKLSHHGIDQHTNTSYVESLNPQYAVQTASIKAFSDNNLGICEETRILKDKNIPIYPCFMQKDFIEFESRASSLNVKKGIAGAFSGQTIPRTYYVDITVSDNEIQDGSQAHPFKEVMQAISAIPNTHSANVTINVKPGYYCNPHDREVNKNRLYVDSPAQITINGVDGDNSKVVINGCYFRNSEVTLKDLTIDCDNKHGIYAVTSHVSLDNVNITSHTSTLSTTNSGVVLRNGSTLDVVRASISYVNEGIVSTYSTINIPNNSLTIGSFNTSAINAGITSVKHIGTIAFANQSDANTFNNYYINQSSPRDLTLAHDEYATTINLKDSLANYDWVEVFYKSSDSTYGSTGRIYSPDGRKTRVEIAHVGLNGTRKYNKSVRLNFSGNTITLQDCLQEIVNLDTYAVVNYTKEETPNISILRVIAGKKDYI